jgi:hypothetical protein
MNANGDGNEATPEEEGDQGEVITTTAKFNFVDLAVGRVCVGGA